MEINGLPIDDDISELFTYHTPTAEQIGQFEKIKEAGMYFAQVIRNNSPKSANQTLALQHVVDARMRANAAIATNGRNFDR
jgi:hypothetical protein